MQTRLLDVNCYVNWEGASIEARKLESIECMLKTIFKKIHVLWLMGKVLAESDFFSLIIEIIQLKRMYFFSFYAILWV